MFFFSPRLFRLIPVCSVWWSIRTNGFPSTPTRWHACTSANAVPRCPHICLLFRMRHIETCCRTERINPCWLPVCNNTGFGFGITFFFNYLLLLFLRRIWCWQNGEHEEGDCLFCISWSQSTGRCRRGGQTKTEDCDIGRSNCKLGRMHMIMMGKKEQHKWMIGI